MVERGKRKVEVQVLLEVLEECLGTNLLWQWKWSMALEECSRKRSRSAQLSGGG